MTEVVGVDLGGTKIAFACFDGQRSSAESAIVATDTSGSDALIEQLVEGVAKCRGAHLDGGRDRRARRSSSSRPGASSPRPTSRCATCRCASVLGERLGVPVFVDNDATVAALAEAHDHGPADGCRGTW